MRFVPLVGHRKAYYNDAIFWFSKFIVMSLDQHPVPQNVTTFQFRLIGDMTIKQFAYLAFGAILAFVSYKLPLPLLITWPLTAVFALLGVGFAFMPIEDRPMDIWVFSFLKNVYSPTVFVWKKRGRVIDRVAAEAPRIQVGAGPATQSAPSMPVNVPSSSTVVPVQTPLSTTKVTTKPPQPSLVAIKTPAPPVGRALSATLPISKNAWNPLGWFLSLFSPKQKAASQPSYPMQNETVVVPAAPVVFHMTKPQAPQPMAPIVTPSVSGYRPKDDPPQEPSPAINSQQEQTSVVANEKMKLLESKLKQMETELSSKTQADARVLELQKQLMQLMQEKKLMDDELLRLKKTSALPHQPTQTATTAAPAPAKPTVRIISPDAARGAGLPRLTSFPNVVTGIVKDASGALLPGVLVTVRDKQDVPLRALKTNKLGQFAASTPLSNGEFFIDIEDPRTRFVFDRAHVILNGTVLPAIEIIAKSQKEITRDKLTKELFGDQQL